MNQLKEESTLVSYEREDDIKYHLFKHVLGFDATMVFIDSEFEGKDRGEIVVEIRGRTSVAPKVEQQVVEAVYQHFTNFLLDTMEIIDEHATGTMHCRVAPEVKITYVVNDEDEHKQIDDSVIMKEEQKG